jgi:hypothetical protein
MPSSAATPLPTENVSTPHRPLRRLTFELFAIIVLKIALLTLIWWLLFAPQPKPDTSPQAIAHLLAPTSQTPSAGHP